MEATPTGIKGARGGTAIRLHNICLVISGNGTIRLHNGNSRRDTYVPDGNGGYTSPKGVFTNLRYDSASQTYVLRARHGTRTTFDSTGRLIALTDIDGNTISFTYDAVSGKLTKIIDTLSREYDLTYASHGRIEKLTDFSGREVVYGYDSDYNLISVRTPTVTSTGGFDDFSSGRTEYYNYLSNTGHAKLDHNLSGCVKPNDVSLTTAPWGIESVKFEYCSDTLCDNFDYVTRQWLGGNNGSGSAGGWIRYNYENVDVTSPLGSVGAVRIRATVTDRRGQKTELDFNENGHALEVREYTGSLVPGEPSVYATKFTYDSEGRILRETHPAGNYTDYQYAQGLLRFQEGNVVRADHYPGPRGGAQATRTVTRVWEPIFGKLCAEADERGNDPNYVPDNGGTTSPSRYTTEYICDYMEGSGDPLDPDDVGNLLAAELDVTRAEVLALLATAGVTLHDADLNGDGQQTNVRGHMVQVRQPIVNLDPLGGALQENLEGDSSQVAITSWTHNEYGQTTSRTDAEENVALYIYFPENDPDGDGIINPIPGLDPLTGGYLRTTILDSSLPSPHPQHSGLSVRGLSEDIGRNSNRSPAADPTSITTDYQYNPVGNVIATIDPRGVKTEYKINELNEIWEILRASDVTGVPLRKGGHDPTIAEDLSGHDYAYIERYKRDENGNIVEVHIENRDNLADAGSVPGFYEISATYDILNNIRTLTTEVDGLGGTVTYTAHYDENENLTAVQRPEGNILTARYESRDFLWQLTRGDNDTSPTNPPPSGSSTNTVLYDANGNVIAEKDAGDNNGDGQPEEVQFTYDGYNRITRILDPLGGETLYTYDPRGNVKTRVLKGHPGGPSPSTNSTSGNVTFEETEFYYDERSRRFRLDRFLLENPMPARDGPLTPSDNRISEKVEHDRLGRMTFLVGDDSQATEFLYDGASRPIRTIDEGGNEVQAEFDDNGNAILITEIETYPTGSPVPTRSFETFNIYDSLDRILSTTDQLGRTHRWEYDSRNNVIKFSDAVSWTFATDPINGLIVNAQGNVTRFLHDGMDRTVQCDKELRTQGHGTCPIDTSNLYNSDGLVTTIWVWDGNDRLSTIKDDKGNQVTFQYDSLDRLDLKTYCDSTFVDYDYDADDNIVRILDPLGNEILTIYDGINRPIAVHANTVSGVVGTTDQQFEYDGLHRLTKSRDSVDGTLGSNDWVVDRQWDSLSRVVSETQNGRTITSTWKEEAKRDSITYPSGLSLTAAFDELDRLTTLADGSGTIATYQFVGPIRVLDKNFGNGTSVRYHDGTLDDSAYYDSGRRPIRVDHQGAAGLLAGFSYQLDWANNRRYEKRVHDGNKGDNFAYDSLYRLVDFEQNVPSSDVGQPGMGNEEKHRTWTFDGVQSWRENTLDTATHLNTVNCENEYVQFQGKTISRDANGNLVSPDTSGLITYSYDFRNRLRSVTDGQGRTIDYDYDAEGRRVRIFASGLPTLPTLTEFVYDSDNVVEEWDANSTLVRRYVTSSRLDDVLRIENLTFYPGTGTYYLHNDGNANVRCLTDGNGTVVERYRYDAFGAPEFLDSSGQIKSSTRSDYGNPYLFTRRRYEEEIRPIYYYRARHYDPEPGRFMQREPGGIWFDPVNLGNGYAYVGNNPRNFIDPRGEGIETGLDIAGAALSARDMWNEPSFANAGMLVWDALSIIPGVPGSWVKRGVGFLGDGRKAQAASRRAKKAQGNAHHGPSGPPPTNRRPDADGGAGTSGNGRGSCSQGDGYDLGSGEGPGGIPLAPRAKDKYGSGSGSSSPPNGRSDGGGGGGRKKYDKHHMLPTALLKRLPERLRKLGIVRGMKGRKNIWPIERRLHKKLHRGGKRKFRGRGGEYNQRAMELLEEAIGEVGGNIENLTGEMLNGIREALAKEFKLGRFRPK